MPIAFHNTSTLRVITRAALAFTLGNVTAQVLAQCDFKYTWFVNTASNEVSFYFINHYQTFPDGVTFTLDPGDGGAPIANTMVMAHEYATGHYLACLTGMRIQNGDTCSFTFCDSVVVGMDAPCADTVLFNNVPNTGCATNQCCYVCGCNGVEYDNACEAQHAGVKRYASGRCSGNTNIWDYGIAVQQCGRHIEARLGGCTSTCYEQTGWSFGDGDSSIAVDNALASVTHDYVDPGEYTLCVMLQDPEGNIDPQVLCTTIVISSSDQCAASFSATLVGDSLFLHNTSTSTTPLDQTVWTISDEEQGFSLTSFDAAPSFLLPGATGIITVCLTTYDQSCLCYADTCMPIDLSAGVALVKERADIVVFPDPIVSQAMIASPIALRHATLTIHDMRGHLVRRIDDLSGTSVTFQRGTLPDGCYVFRVSEGDMVRAVRKVILQGRQ